MKHHLMIGTWTPPGAIFTIAFDTTTHSLELIKRTEIPHDEPISWLTINHARKNLYGAGMKKWSSYAVDSPTEIRHHASLAMGGDPRANDANTKTRAIFVLAAKKAPFLVYGNPFYEHAGVINVHSVNSDGGLDKNVQNAELDVNSAVHGMVFDAEEEYLYSADMWANKIWCHKKDPQSGHLTLISSTPAPAPNDHPRWLEISPCGTHLYVLMESGNRLCIYTLDPTTHTPHYTQTSYPLVPPGIDTLHPKMYRSDVVFRSSSGNYLFATSRSNSPKLTGYIAAFKLGDKGEVERQICLNPTPTSGGHSNAVSPCPWSDEWVALCDDEVGFVEVYRWHEEFLGRVARLEVGEPGFGMNAVWYD
ncbi:hypothetical protein LTR91_009957 [Friedmanniomyces endolithicus]|uniref:Carboxy-cis,cis-muconate cyclase n=1 Tax=Friedmanniomyces endolithicus TaxID=329885 RepID=A0AAN6KK80_9PEZI|nr:hypothetical protein LTR94_002707 [Friedmanniomyces endolithicus]KAK0794572.1 hypothetical protein LTR59_007757 [Friedmanniomyces endolithicus]KAK0797902.1 hypothetical protein LTR75_009719 [Friedmanniomyces endolithicus]KAK0800636.1 hypothetical protein LTR38_007070 [Friedmanniomyces endolithicus]KAK0849067.1 hypothetical protein LTR03_005392 [Friedmanniomyces endolithicus]